MCIRDSINAEYGDDGQRSMSEATAAAEAETQDANTGASAVSSEAAALIALAEAFGGARPEWSEFSAIPKYWEARTAEHWVRRGGAEILRGMMAMRGRRRAAAGRAALVQGRRWSNAS
eukprot:TRINITY_DN3693_c0_g2_i1.p1 TRINITY_DN3693_c0_g2~~TRINITY_DN3693_c0_g2_i1.p1  ORF type:complete len:118 (-),score=35.36 TRINITY_DN3693_c0_g2_i1:409-762(-)